MHRYRIVVGLWLSLGCAAPSFAIAQEEFPAGVTSPSASELTQRLAGKSFFVQLKNGVSWRLQYNSLGYFFVDTSTGGRATGSWTVEDGRLCAQVRNRDTSPQCSDVRLHQDRLIVRRTVDGELITFEPR